MSVVVYHYFSTAAFPVALRFLASFGWAGVDLFFVMSGFLIGGIVLDRRDAPNFLSVFYIRRALRILPLYYLLLILGAVGAFFGVKLGAAKYFIAQFLFLQNFALAFTQKTSNLGPEWLSPTWSLAVEEHFYLGLPLLIAVVRPTRLRAVIIGLAAGSALMRAVVFLFRPEHTWVITFLWTPCRIEELLDGVLVASLFRAGGGTLSHGGGGRWLPSASLLFGAVLVAASMLDRRADSYVLTNTIGVTSAGVCFSLLLVVVMRPSGGWPRSAMSLPLLRWLGIRAYGIYLLHLPVQLFVDLYFASLPIEYNRAVALALTLLLASASWTLLESRLVQVSHRFKYSAA